MHRSQQISPEIDKYQRGWTSGLPETPCGYGSTLQATVQQREILADWVKRYGVESVVDVGAGDLRWVRKMRWPHPVTYQALDLVPRSAEVAQFDLIQSVPPKADMIWCIWVLNHLKEDAAQRALANLLASGCTWLVYTWRPVMFPFLNLASSETVSLVYESAEPAELRLVKC